jgi:hypothetical protein
MGLTIHWSTCAPPTATLTEVTAALAAWREACLDLPFVEVTDLTHSAGEQLARRLKDPADPERWFLIQGCRHMPADPADEDSRYVSIDPVELIGFTAFPGESCEPMNCLLALYPAVLRVDGRERPTGLEGWQGRGFAQTQYASVRGAEYFLQCHLTIIAALDAAQRLGLLQSVMDEGDYWDERDAAKLLRTVGRWNAMMAAFVSAMEEATGKSLPAPIKEHPHFERLEHLGTTPDTAAMAKAIAAAIEQSQPPEQSV